MLLTHSILFFNEAIVKRKGYLIFDSLLFFIKSFNFFTIYLTKIDEKTTY